MARRHQVVDESTMCIKDGYLLMHNNEREAFEMYHVKLENRQGCFESVETKVGEIFAPLHEYSDAEQLVKEFKNRFPEVQKSHKPIFIGRMVADLLQME